MPEAQAVQLPPSVFVLAGVNGAGKSSVGGALLKDKGMDWFNPDSFARELVKKTGCPIEEANSSAWAYGRDALQQAIDTAQSWAFETTLGGNTIPSLIRAACGTHRVVVLYCGLATADLHVQRVRQRVEHGGHDIPEEKIRERWRTSREHLIELIPTLHALQVFDNSNEAAAGDPIPDPVLLLETDGGRVVFPLENNEEALRNIPEWAKPIVQAAFNMPI